MYYLTNKYCCTCLNTESTKLIDLTSFDSDSISFYEKLSICIPNRISLEMKIQENFLCDDCSRNISQFYDFYNICMKSKAILDNIGLKVQYFKVGDQNTVVNIIPNDYYSFDNSNETEKTANNTSCTEGRNELLTKKRKTHKTTTELVNTILKEKVIQDSSYTCNICHKKFHKKGLLIVHITIEHSKADDKPPEPKTDQSDRKDHKKYTCGYCDKIFTSNSALCRHKKIHTNDRRYACDLCSVRYIQKAQIINHMNKYHPGYVYEEKKCKTCRKIFETKDDLEIHNKINHELKFDLKTLEILQSSNGNIRNIIECIHANTGSDVTNVNSINNYCTASIQSVSDDNGTGNLINSHVNNTDVICINDNFNKDNFVANCDLIEYNNDLIKSIDNVNVIDLDVIGNDNIIEESPANESVDNILNVPCNLGDDVLGLNKNIDDNNLDVTVDNNISQVYLVDEKDSNLDVDIFENEHLSEVHLSSNNNDDFKDTKVVNKKLFYKHDRLDQDNKNDTKRMCLKHILTEQSNHDKNDYL